MSAVQAGGSKGAGQSSGSGQRSGAGNRRAPSAKPGQRTADRDGRGLGAGSGGKGPGAGGRQGRPISSPPPRWFSTSAIAFGTIGVVVVIVVVLVLVKVVGGSNSSPSTSSPSTSSPSTSSPSTSSPSTSTGEVAAPASLISQVTSVSSSVAKAVGVPSSVYAPSVLKGQQPLTLDGKPGAVFIGAEFCPYCAAARWAIVMAFSKFGTFSGLKETKSSAWEYAPSTATFSFYDASYSSNLITFQPVEVLGNDTNGLGTEQALQKLTAAQSNLWAAYSGEFDVSEGFPFLDIGNKVFVVGESYDPEILSKLDQSAIAGKLGNPNDPVTRAIVGLANYLTAAICSITNRQPGPVCSATGTAVAAKALKLS